MERNKIPTFAVGGILVIYGLIYLLTNFFNLIYKPEISEMFARTITETRPYSGWILGVAMILGILLLVTNKNNQIIAMSLAIFLIGGLIVTFYTTLWLETISFIFNNGIWHLASGVFIILEADPKMAKKLKRK